MLSKNQTKSALFRLKFNLRVVFTGIPLSGGRQCTVERGIISRNALRVRSLSEILIY